MWSREKIKDFRKKVKEFLKRTYRGIQVLSDSYYAYLGVGAVCAALGITSVFLIALLTVLIAYLVASFIRQNQPQTA
jgi:hypothetical protein